MSQQMNMPYGAFELKHAYQKNMAIGTTSVIGIVAILSFLAIVVFNFDKAAKRVDVGIISDPGPAQTPISIIDPPKPIIGPRRGGGGGNNGANGAIIYIPFDDDSDNNYIDDSPYPYDGPNNDVNAGIEMGQSGNRGGGTSDDFGYPSPDEFIKVEKEPEFIYQETPIYPRMAETSCFSAIVIVEAFVGKDGKVKKAQIVRCSRPDIGFEEASLNAAYNSVFKPAIQNGDPIGVWISYTVKFIPDSK